MPVNTYEKMFTRGPESALPQEFNDGTIKFTIDTGRLFVDGQNSRTEISDFVKGMTESEIRGLLAPLTNKIYISSDTNKFMLYNANEEIWNNIAVVDINSEDVITDITRNGFDFIATKLNGSTFSFNQQQYTGNNGISVNGTNITNSGVRSIATGGTNGTINVNTNGSTANIAVKGLGSAAYTESSAYAAANHTHSYAGSSSAGGIANSANLLYYIHTNEINFLGGNQNICYFNYRDAATDGPNAVNNMSYRFCNYSNDVSKSTLYAGNYVGNVNGYSIAASVPSGAKFTDTTYTGSDGVSLTGTNFTNSGVRAIATGTTNGTINVNTNGSTANISVYGLGSNAYTSTSYLPLSGGTMTGTVITPPNEIVIDFRNHSSYHCTASYQTAGNEALVFATKNPVTSFMFVSGEDSVTNHAQDRWKSLTPGLQIKQNCVSINKLITDGVTPTYNLEINGTEYVSGALTIGGVFKGTCGEFAGGRVYNQGDDEGIIIKPATGGYAGLILGSHNARRSVFYLNNDKVFWRYNDGSASHDINHPGKSGTIALTSDITAMQTTLQSNFQAGVDSVYNAIVAKGTTPASKSLSDVVTAIGKIATTPSCPELRWRIYSEGSTPPGFTNYLEFGYAFSASVTGQYFDIELIKNAVFVLNIERTSNGASGTVTINVTSDNNAAVVTNVYPRGGLAEMCYSIVTNSNNTPIIHIYRKVSGSGANSYRFTITRIT